MTTNNPASGQEDSRTKRVRQQIGVLFAAQIMGLHKLVESFGGDKLALRFDVQVLEAAKESRMPLTLKGGKIQRLRTDQPWQIYVKILEEAMAFATTVAGKRLVAERTQIVIDGLESLTGKGFHETAFRFGLTRSR